MFNSDSLNIWWGILFAYVSPLCVVVVVSLLKELADDVNRRIQDIKTNSTKITTIQFAKNPKQKSKEKKGKMSSKSKKQLKELNDLYNLVSNNKENFFEKYPNKSVEKYFKKYF